MWISRDSVPIEWITVWPVEPTLLGGRWYVPRCGQTQPTLLRQTPTEFGVLFPGVEPPAPGECDEIGGLAIVPKKESDDDRQRNAGRVESGS